MYYLNNIKIKYDSILGVSIKPIYKYIKYKKNEFSDNKIKIKKISYYNCYYGQYKIITKYCRRSKKTFKALPTQLLINDNKKIKNKYEIYLYNIIKNSDIMDWIKENLQYPVLITTVNNVFDYYYFNVNFIFMSKNDLISFKLRWL